MIKPTGFFRNKTDSLIKLGPGAGRAVRRRGAAARSTDLVDAARHRPQDGQRHPRQRLRRARHHRRHPLPAAGPAAGAGPTETDPVKIEHAVGALIEKRDWTMLSHRVIFHGRRVCHARKPACGACTLAPTVPVVRHRPDRPGRGGQAAQGPPGRASSPRWPASTRRWCPRRPSRRTCRERAVRDRSLAAPAASPAARPPAARPPPTAAAGRPRRRRRPPSPFADCAGAGGAAGSPPVRRRPAARRPAPALPDVDAALLHRRRRRCALAELRGPAVINLWASWCAPCREELPAFQRLADAPAARCAVLGVDHRRRPGRGARRVGDGPRGHASRPCSTPTASCCARARRRRRCR